jgi:sporulation protein YlmC with PRC-barrel domain
MTEPKNPITQGTEPSAVRQRQLRQLAQEIENGLPVYDFNGERVGNVKDYSALTVYLQVSAGVLGQKDLYLPSRLIADIRAQEIDLLEARDTLAPQYSSPPALHMVVENRAAPGGATRQTGGAREVQLVESGYDGSITEISAVELSSIAERLSVGLTVYDVDGARLGEIEEYDANRWLMVVESGAFSPVYRVVPFSAIGSVNRDTQSVNLTVQADALHKTHGLVGDW